MPALVLGSQSVHRATRRHRANTGKIEVCNARYGFNGWPGLAQIWISGSHIVKATAKMNDTYFDSPGYDYTAERHVFCQEVGHGYGLAHQDESGADLNTCMDYSNGLDNPHPNAHDYEQLETIYNSHFDSGGSPAFSPQAGARVSVRRIDRISSSEIVADYGHGYRIVTHITWAPRRRQLDFHSDCQCVVGPPGPPHRLRQGRSFTSSARRSLRADM